ncbi:MAG: KaiA-binding protein [Candidatus Lokiarchaeota archaeon]|nr:KaiA-binding protein [Candidatus Lokiarchaeota archaeon]
MLKERIKTGIPDLDAIIEGGFIIPSVILVLGLPGTGKTSFSMNYLFEGAKHNEKGLYISTLSESTSSIINFGSKFWFFDPKKIGRKIFIVELGKKMEYFQNKRDILDEIFNKVEEFDISRVVIDPINPFNLILPSLRDYRIFLYEFSQKIKEYGIQATITAELYDANCNYCHEAYISDGTILLQTVRKENKMMRELIIAKMRGTSHSLEPIQYILTSKGFVLQALDGKKKI